MDSAANTIFPILIFGALGVGLYFHFTERKRKVLDKFVKKFPSLTKLEIRKIYNTTNGDENFIHRLCVMRSKETEAADDLKEGNKRNKISDLKFWLFICLPIFSVYIGIMALFAWVLDGWSIFWFLLILSIIFGLCWFIFSFIKEYIKKNIKVEITPKAKSIITWIIIILVLAVIFGPREIKRAEKQRLIDAGHVYYTTNGEKYHLYVDCSGMNKPRLTNEEEAYYKRGLRRCKICYGEYSDDVP